MEEMSLQEFVDVLLSTGVIVKDQREKWEDVLNKLSIFYYERAVEFSQKIPTTSKYYAEISDKLFNYLCDRKYYE